jgi:hypothetical protein
MLLSNKKFTDGDVITMKLASGEEVLGKYVSEDMASLTLSKPLMIAMTQKGPAMAPILMTVDPEKNLTFSKNQITILEESDKEIANQYIFQTTGIQPVSNGSIIKG